MQQDKVCRVCITHCSKSTLYNLFEVVALDAEGNEIHLHEMLSYCCSVQFDTNSSLSICKSCSKSCSNAYNFIKLFHKNTELFNTAVIKREILLDEIEINDTNIVEITQNDIFAHNFHNNDEVLENFNEFSNIENREVKVELPTTCNKELVIHLPRENLESTPIRKTHDSINVNEIIAPIGEENGISFDRQSNETQIEVNDQNFNNNEADIIFEDLDQTDQRINESEVTILDKETGKKKKVNKFSKSATNDQNWNNRRKTRSQTVSKESTINRETDKSVNNSQDNIDTDEEIIDEVNRITFNLDSEEDELENIDQVSENVDKDKSRKNFKNNKDNSSQHIDRDSEESDMEDNDLPGFDNADSESSDEEEAQINKNPSKSRINKDGVGGKKQKVMKKNADNYYKSFIIDRIRTNFKKIFKPKTTNDDKSDRNDDLFNNSEEGSDHVDREVLEEENRINSDEDNEEEDNEADDNNSDIDNNDENSISNSEPNDKTTEDPTNIKNDEIVRNKFKEKKKSPKFKCPVCNEIFNQYKSLKMHVTQHLDQKFICNLCNKVCNNYKQFQYHYTKEHYCYVCKLCFSNCRRYKAHMIKKHKDKMKSKMRKNSPMKRHNIDIKCPVCDEKFDLYKSFKEHISQHADQVFLCNLCNKLCSDYQEFQVHYFNNHCNYCDICDMTFSRYLISICHKLNRHRSPEDPSKSLELQVKEIVTVDREGDIVNNLHECPVCRKVFFRYTNFQNHVIQHRDQEFSCRLCEKKCENCNVFKKHHFKDHYTFCHICNIHFATHKLYLKHKRKFHVNVITETEWLRTQENYGRETFKCPVCSKICYSYHFLKNHIKQHQDQIFICNLCSKVCRNCDVFEEHFFASHYTFCEICKLRFSTRKVWRNHQSVKHKDTKSNPTSTKTGESCAKKSIENKERIKCPVCNTAHLRTYYDLKSHMSEHPNKEIICHKCSKICANGDEFLEHYFKDHYCYCDICKISFSTRLLWWKHKYYRHKDLQVKTQENYERSENKRLIKCPICETIFETYEALKDHVNQHSDKEFVCHLCSRRCEDYTQFEQHYSKYHYNFCTGCNTSFPTSQEFDLHNCRIFENSGEPQNYIENHVVSKSVKEENYNSIREEVDKSIEEGNDKSVEQEIDKSVEISKDKYFKCPVCDKHFPLYNSLKDHVSRHTNEEFTCHLCSKQCGNFADFDEHFFKDHYTYCVICDRRFESRKKYSKHKSEKHRETSEKSSTGKRQRYIKCPVCELAFSTYNIFQKHLSQHPDQEMNCQECGKRCACCEELRKHYFADHYCYCDICDIRFPIRRAYENHKYKAHKKAENASKPIPVVPNNLLYLEKFKCPICDCISGMYSTFMKHVSQHQDEEFTCRECNKSYKDYKEFQVHFDKDHYNCCTICNISFSNHRRYLSHKGTWHKNTKDYQKSVLLNADNRSKKNIEKIHKCPVCDRIFKTYEILKRHISQHSKEKFTCHLCSKRCTNYKHFQIHYYKAHICYCQVCKMRFNSIGKLQWHQRTSSRHKKLMEDKDCKLNKTLKEDTLMEEEREMFYSKRHKCPVCNDAFFNYRNFTKHLELHPNQVFKCHLCKTRCNNSNQFEKHYFELHYNYCTICKISFSKRIHYQKHKYRHGLLKETETKPSISENSSESVVQHNCPVCKKIFVDYETFKKHVVHHSKEKCLCGLCSKRCISSKEFLEHYTQDHYNYCQICDVRFATHEKYDWHCKTLKHIKEALLRSTENLPKSTKVTRRKGLKRKCSSRVEG